MPITPSLLGWLLIAAAVCTAAGVGRLDRELRRRRTPAMELRLRQPVWDGSDGPLAEAMAAIGSELLRLYDRVVPQRWHGRYYDAAGAALVERIWALLALTSGFLVVGIILVAYPAQ